MKGTFSKVPVHRCNYDNSWTLNKKTMGYQTKCKCVVDIPLLFYAIVVYLQNSFLHRYPRENSGKTALAGLPARPPVKPIVAKQLYFVIIFHIHPINCVSLISSRIIILWGLVNLKVLRLGHAMYLLESNGGK